MGAQTQLSTYKKYARGVRVQIAEEAFNKGMYYTNTPLNEGYQKVLVNFDTKDAGEILLPRAGLRVFETDNLFNTTILEDPTCIIGKDCREENTKDYRQILLGFASDVIRSGTSIYEGTLSSSTINRALARTDFDLDKQITLGTLNLNETNIPCYFRKPTKAEIHGMDISDITNISSNIGCFGFGNHYYCFGGTSKLKYSKFDATTETYGFDEVEVKDITAADAVTSGYNMLSTTPYSFVDAAGVAAITLTGILPYEQSTATLKLHPKLNQTLTYRLYYSAPVINKYKIVWEWKSVAGTSWEKFATKEYTMTDLPNISIDYSSPILETLIRATAYLYNTTTSTYEVVPEATMTVGFTYVKSETNTTSNTDPVVYDLSTAAGMTYWQNRLVVYGVEKNPLTLFTSGVNQPGYFPYPNGADIYDEPIIHVTPFLDNMLVFTKSRLYLVTLSADGATWTRKMIQGNLDINDWDVHLIQVVKNMVFFKSGNYFYMVVPKSTSLTGELVIAPVSKPIEGLLDNFKTNITEIVDQLYGYTGTLALTHYYNFLDFEDVHNVYTFKTTKDWYLNVHLLYNTVDRTWRIHTYSSAYIMHPYKQDATKKGTLISLTSLRLNTVKSYGTQLYQFNKNLIKDYSIPVECLVGPSYSALTDLTLQQSTFKNYQLLDTGYREHYTDYYKRYRELQLKINNTSQVLLNFATEYSIDGNVRKTFYRYDMTQDSDTGILTLERVPVDYSEVPGTTVLARNDIDVNAWSLDSSMFPEAVLWKIRIPLSGKGLSPKLRLLSFNEETFELLNIAWYFRSLNAR